MSEHDDDEVEPALVRLGDALSPAHDVRRKANIARILGDDPPVTKIGRFAVVDYLGHGAMGEVYAAHDDRLDRRVAIKVLAGPISEAALDRFGREARALAKLSHPNIVQIHEVGEHDGAMFIAMELVAGRTLAQWLAPGIATWREVVHIFLEAGRGLAAAHAANLVHRDFKPDNVMVGDDGRVRVLDFGLARPVEGGELPERTNDERRPHTTSGSGSSERLTKTGSLVGTPAYMAPEQLRTAAATALSDQFSFCVALHEGLFGVRPFAGRDPFVIAEAIEARRFQPPKRSAPRWLATVVHRGLAVRPEDRWPSMDALLAVLTRRSAPRRRFVAGAIGMGLAIFGGGLWYQADLGQRCSGGDQRIAEIWNDARRVEIQDAVLGTEATFAARTWAELEPRLDAHARAWALAYRGTCEATEVRREQSPVVMDAKMSCLDRQRSDLRAALDVLAAADPAVVEKAVPLVSGLPAPSECDDVTDLESDPLVPGDPALALRVDAERERLARVKSLQRSGQYVAAEAAATEALEIAEEIGHGPLVAELKDARAAARAQLVQIEGAREDALSAYLLATELEHDRVATSASLRLSWILGRQESQYEAAMGWARTALALSRRRSGTKTEQALALDAVAGVLNGLNRMAEAADHEERAVALIEESEGPRSLQLAQMLTGLGGIRRMTQDLPGARELLERALQIEESVLGPDHPRVAGSLNQLAATHNEGRDLDEALALYRRALAIMEAVGYPHPTLAGTLNGIGLALTRQRKPEEAVPYFERALSTYEQTLGADHPDAARVWTALADARKSTGDLEGTLEAHRQALAIRKKTLPAGSYVTATSTLSVGQFLVELGQYDEGRALILEALEVLEGEQAEQTAGKPRLILAMAYGSLSTAARAQEDVEPAIEYAERSAELADYPGTSVGVRSWAQEQLLQSLWLDPTQRRRAHDLAEQAIADNIREGVTDERHVAGFRAWLADHPLPDGE